MRHAAFAVLAILAAACAVNPPTTHYVVRVDPSATDEELSAVVEAARYWTRAVSLPLVIDVVRADCHESSVLAYGVGVICLTFVDGEAVDCAGNPGTHIEGCTFREGEGATTRIARSHQFAAFQTRIVAHELGHAMGLHHSAPGTLMAAEVPDQSPLPTDVDVEQWWARR